MAKKDYYQREITVNGQAASHTGTDNWRLLFSPGDQIRVGDVTAQITAIDTPQALTFSATLPQGTQQADFEVQRRNAFNTADEAQDAVVAKPLTSTASQSTTAPARPNPLPMTLGRLQDVSKGSVATWKRYYFNGVEKGDLQLIEVPPPAAVDITDEWITVW